MSAETIIEGLKDVIATVKPTVDTSRVTMNTHLLKDLGIDSLAMLLMSLAVETKFNFQFKTKENFYTVGDVVNYIQKATEK